MQTAFTFCWGYALGWHTAQYHWLAGWSQVLVTWQDHRVTQFLSRAEKILTSVLVGDFISLGFMFPSRKPFRSTVASPFLCREEIYLIGCVWSYFGKSSWARWFRTFMGPPLCLDQLGQRKGTNTPVTLAQAIRPFREAWSPAWDWMIGHI